MGGVNCIQTFWIFIFFLYLRGPLGQCFFATCFCGAICSQTRSLYIILVVALVDSNYPGSSILG